MRLGLDLDTLYLLQMTGWSERGGTKGEQGDALGNGPIVFFFSRLQTALAKSSQTTLTRARV
jgi:hypothetical protein